VGPQMYTLIKLQVLELKGEGGCGGCERCMPRSTAVLRPVTHN
jgi:hypothetical protein